MAGIPKKPVTSQAGTAPLEVVALSRLAFGPTEASLAAFRAGGSTPRTQLAAYLDTQTAPDSIRDDDCTRRLGQLQLTTLQKPLPVLWQDHHVAANKLKDSGKGDEGELRKRPLHETEIATWVRAVYSRCQLREVLVDFWHTHFSIYAPENQIASTFASFDRDVIRPHAFGNFRTLLGAVAESPAMLFYLDNFVNQSGNPNENYARELFELHTLGAEHYLGTEERTAVPGYKTGAPVGYVDGDVYEAARCFTGWRPDTGNKSTDTGVFQYFEAWHDRFQKIVLGHPIREYQPPQQDGRDVLDMLCEHHGTARHIARKLCIRLVSDEPSPALIEGAAQVFRQKRKDKDQLAGVVRFIATSQEFAQSYGQKLRRPFDFAVAALRATGAELKPDEDFLKETGRLGQRLFQWRTPDGYPDIRAKWGSTVGMLERWRFCNQLVNGKLSGVDLDTDKLTPATVKTPQELAAFWLHKILPRPAAPFTTQAVAGFLAQGRSAVAPLNETQRQERVSAAVALALMSPEFQWR